MQTLQFKMMTRRLALGLLAVMGLRAAANAQAVTGTQIQASVSTGFGSYSPYTVPKYQAITRLNEPAVAADFANVATIEQNFPWQNFFTANERDLLQKNDFVARPEAFGNFSQAYARALMSTELGSFVTVDAIFQGLRVTADESLRSMERDYTAPMLASLTADLSKSLGAQLNAERNPTLANSLLRLLAYTETAQTLLDPSASVDTRTSKMVDAELEKIRSASGVVASTIFPNRRLDYSQFAPIGYYRLSDTLRDYYRAKKWLGTIGFELRSSNGTVDLSEARMGLLLARTMGLLAANGDFSEQYQSVIEPLAFFTGRSDMQITWDMIAGSLRGYFGRIGMANTSVLADDADLKAFISYAQAQLPSELTGKGAYTFRLMSRDADAGKALSDQLRRSGGSYGLAMMAAIGSDRAAQIQSGNSDAATASLGANGGKMIAENWVQDFDHAVLYTVRPMLMPVDRSEGYPRFMRSAAWHDRELGSALGAWAAFQRDVTTMPMQKAATAASFGRRDASELRSEGYVEPNPEAWARLASLASYLRNGLTEKGYGSLVSGKVASKLQDIENVSAELMRIASLELSNKDLSDAQTRLIESIGDRIAAYESFSDKSLQGEGATVVAGASTEGTANGNPLAIYVIVPRNDGVGGLMLTRGAIYSYFETNSSDDEWRRTMTTSGSTDIPVMDWMKSYLSSDRAFAQDARKFQAVTASLPSVAAVMPTGQKRVLSSVQLNLESNVVSRSVGELWFTVRAPQMNGNTLILSVVNNAGQTVYQTDEMRIQNGEHYDMVPVTDLQNGQYFVRVNDLLDHTLASGRFLVVR